MSYYRCEEASRSVRQEEYDRITRKLEGPRFSASLYTTFIMRIFAILLSNSSVISEKRRHFHVGGKRKKATYAKYDLKSPGSSSTQRINTNVR